MRAQQKPDVQKRPKRALFEAYEDVFAEKHLDTRQDRACLRTILQLGEPGIPGDALYDKFEFVLRQIGVHLDFADDESPGRSDHQAAARSHPGDKRFEKEAFLQASLKRPTRRASFTSMHDVTTEQIQLSRPLRSPRASESRLPDGRGPLAVVQQKNLPTPMLQTAKPIHQRRFSHDSPGSKRNGMKAVYNERFHGSKHYPSNNGISDLGTEGRRYGQFRQDGVLTSDEIEISLPKLYPPDPSRQAAADLDRVAEAFEDVRRRNMQKALLSRWACHARGRLEHVQGMELQAVNKDVLTLKRQAFDFWRAAYNQKRQQIREERFFEHLRNRAGQAYDLYLLTKSFTHWIQITAAAVAKTNAARQRFLFTKYFNAWYQLTVTNELKAERQALKAPLNLLKRRAAQYYRDQVNALEVYHDNLTKYVFWRWFRKWCDRAAPRYREQQLQRRTFSKWLRKSRDIRSRQVEVDSGFVRGSLQKVFRIWATKTRIDVAGHQQANAFWKSRLLGTLLVKWHAEAKLKPIADRVLHMRDLRIKRSTFSIWQLRTRMVFRAEAVNRMRTLQNAYTAWNERLRSQALAARMNERLLAETLYKWVIAQRFGLMIRISEQRQKRNAMQSFLAGTRRMWTDLFPKAERLVNARSQRSLESTFGCWRNRTVVIQAHSQMALDFSNKKLKQDTIEAIRLKLRGKQKLEMWAKDARFFFLMTRHITIWRAASAQSKKHREREGHAKMRRKCKMNLARRALFTWSHKRNENLEAGKEADKFRRQKLKVLQQVLFRVWLAAASQRKQEAIQMSKRYNDRLLGHSLGLLVDASRHLYSMQSRAEQFHHLKLSEICSAQLRRFSMRAFEIRRREQDARAMQDRHWNRHVRNIFRHWSSKTQDIICRDLISNAPTEKPQEREPTDAGYGTASNEDQPKSTNENDLGVTHRAEEWTAFDTELLEDNEWIPSLDHEPLVTSTPMPAPAYLQTPSKRAARARALVNLSTTPATTLRTPFAARLRAGMGSSPSHVKVATVERGALGFKSALGSHVKNSGEDD